ncbi:MAG: hypothetical protein SCABRO_03669, partial [Candidatus Scalindua brodae]
MLQNPRKQLLYSLKINQKEGNTF